jgi:hypothetical protein
MRIVVDRLFSGLLGCLAAPPVAIRDEEELFFGEFLKTWKVQVGFGLVVLFPGVE